MLGKLLKHEFISCGKKLLPIYLILVIASFVGKVFIWLVSKKSFINAVPEAFYRIVKSLSSIFSIVYILFIIVILVGTILFLIYRFYQHLFTDEGYLTMTLPVKPYEHVLTKTLSSLVWSIFSGALVLGSIALIVRTEETVRKFHDVIDAFVDMLKRVAVEMDIGYGWLIAEVIIFILFVIITKYLMVFFSITLGSSFSSKNKILSSIVVYIALAVAMQIFSMVVMGGLTNISPDYLQEVADNAGKALQTTILTFGTLHVLLSAVFFYATTHILKKKVNLD